MKPNLPKIVLAGAFALSLDAAAQPALTAGDQLFANRTARAELDSHVGKPMWQLLAECSGFAQAASAYFKANGAASDQKLWASLSLETYSAAQSVLAKDRALDDQQSRDLVNPAAENFREQTAAALAGLDPRSGSQEVFAQETLILRGAQTRLCIAAATETSE